MSSCWHEPVYDRTLQQVDLQIENINIEQVWSEITFNNYY